MVRKLGIQEVHTKGIIFVICAMEEEFTDGAMAKSMTANGKPTIAVEKECIRFQMDDGTLANGSMGSLRERGSLHGAWMDVFGCFVCCCTCCGAYLTLFFSRAAIHIGPTALPMMANVRMD